MKFDISVEEGRQAKIPHEIFLTNLIGNHILWFVSTLGVVRSFWQPIALVPIVSVALLSYTLWRAAQSKRRDPWYVMCHWQMAARRSLLFIGMLSLLGVVATTGWLGHLYGGWKKEAVFAFTGGIGLLPVMVTILVLIIMESDALYQAMQHRLPKWVIEKYPNPGVPVIEEAHSAEEKGESDVSSLG